MVEEQPTEQNEKNTDEVWMSKSGVFESSVIMFFVVYVVTSINL